MAVTGQAGIWKRDPGRFPTLFSCCPHLYLVLDHNHGRNHDIEAHKDRGGRNSTQILQKDCAREGHQGYETSRFRLEMIS